MGQAQSNKIFTDKDLSDYQDLTFLTKLDIKRAYDRFNAICPYEKKNEKNASISINLILEMPEFKVNPFKDRICAIFASDERFMSFEDFLDMVSVFSENATKAVKTEYAFRIYDFDGDDYINEADLKEVINRLIGGNKLEETDMKDIIDNIMVEADLDGDHILNFAEFEHVIAKLPDFENNFRIRL